MGDYLNVDQFPGMTDAEKLIAELEAHLSLHYPCITPDLPTERKTLLAALLVPVIERWHEVGTGLTVSTVTGPFQERTSGGGGHILWEREIADLRAFCGEPEIGGMPDGSFPAPADTDDLFAHRRQR